LHRFLIPVLKCRLIPPAKSLGGSIANAGVSVVESPGEGLDDAGIVDLAQRRHNNSPEVLVRVAEQSDQRRDGSIISITPSEWR
jgi:hypothetical protein